MIERELSVACTGTARFLPTELGAGRLELTAGSPQNRWRRRAILLHVDKMLDAGSACRSSPNQTRSVKKVPFYALGRKGTAEPDAGQRGLLARCSIQLAAITTLRSY
jgi:hypothetical protein